MADVLAAYEDREKGFMPSGPATDDNPATLLDAFRFIDRELSAIQKEDKGQSSSTDAILKQMGVQRG